MGRTNALKHSHDKDRQPPLVRAELPIETAFLARYLIGKLLVPELPEGVVSGRIVETEAYIIGDAAIRVIACRLPAPGMPVRSFAGRPADSPPRAVVRHDRVGNDCRRRNRSPPCPPPARR